MNAASPRYFLTVGLLGVAALPRRRLRSPQGAAVTLIQNEAVGPKL